jgi:hypothetical protein
MNELRKINWNNNDSKPHLQQKFSDVNTPKDQPTHGMLLLKGWSKMCVEADGGQLTSLCQTLIETSSLSTLSNKSSFQVAATSTTLDGKPSITITVTSSEPKKTPEKSGVT